MKNNGDQPPVDPGRIAYLIDGFLRDNLTEVEHDELDAWIEASPENMKLFEELTDEENLQTAQTWFRQHEGNRKRKRQRYKQIKQNIKGNVRSMVWYMAAAALIALCIGLYWFTQNETTGPVSPTAGHTPQSVPVKKRAFLVLADGRTVSLHDEAKMRQHGLALENDVLDYSKALTIDTGYNTVQVPAGEQLKIILADGSTVWLNAGTSFRYAVNFEQHSRNVTLKGEAFFDVRHNPSKPFVVTSNGQYVTVLGTQFNVAAYEGDKMATTLVRGAVRVDAGGKTKLLQPGEQSTVAGSDIVVKKVAVEESTAWKDGVFLFRSSSIETVAAQLQRWYDVDIIYEGKPAQHFNATVRRTESLERVLQVLEGSGYVHFSLKGKKLVIRP